jgi:hypothetical protein
MAFGIGPVSRQIFGHSVQFLFNGCKFVLNSRKSLLNGIDPLRQPLFHAIYSLPKIDIGKPDGSLDPFKPFVGFFTMPSHFFTYAIL